ncbi:uncharacterized protein METZ01_LOCUS324426 [marine metagenome]|uniref:Uncharacterized protein n=1 Tax=marine metagenome TaxID=408172 RepID=A0A382PI08_9ZZZZ
MIISILFVGCATHVHHIGMGPQIGEKITARQWYLFYGLIPINSVNTNKMAGMDMNGDFITNYEIQTQTGPTDILIAIGLGMITFGAGPAIIQSRTVTITK